MKLTDDLKNTVSLFPEGVLVVENPALVEKVASQPPLEKSKVSESQREIASLSNSVADLSDVRINSKMDAAQHEIRPIFPKYVNPQLQEHLQSHLYGLQPSLTRKIFLEYTFAAEKVNQNLVSSPRHLKECSASKLL